MTAMLRFGSLELGTVPRVAVALSDTDVRDEAHKVRKLVDVFELRVDRFSRHEPSFVAEVTAVARGYGVPLLATVRAASEGGAAELSEADRLAILRAVVASVDAVDVELHAAIRGEVVDLCRRHDKPVIVSFHDFERTPSYDDLVGLIESGKAVGADVVKLAATAESRADLDRLLGLLRAHRDQNLILIAMGREGVASRVFFPLFGSLLTWGFLSREGAPGQLQLEDLIDELCRYAPDFARRHGRS
jgi:3-dehydroquinate dehydratase-1